MLGIVQRSFVGYMDRPRECDAAQGYAKPYVWAHHAEVPFAFLSKPLAQYRVVRITTASPWRDQEPVEGVLRVDKQVGSGPTATAPERLFTDEEEPA